MKLKRHLPTLNVLALIAVLLLTAGPPAYAAGKRLITGADVQDSSLTGADVQNGSLSAADMDASVGQPSASYRAFTDFGLTVGGEKHVGVAWCNDENDVVLGGGYSSAHTDQVRVEASQPWTLQHTTLEGWYVGARNLGTAEATLRAHAVCQSVD